MFGNNPIRKQENVTTHLNVQEIFPTIQGEGPFAGRPAVFIRLAGCNLHCWFCDTDFETNAHKLSVVEVVAKAHKHANDINTNLIVLTGGEPLRQNVSAMLWKLLGFGLEIQIETAGTLWVDSLNTIKETFAGRKGLTIVCSPKTPKLHPKIIPYIDYYKYIINDGDRIDTDGLPLESTQQKGKNLQTPKALAKPIGVSPVRVYLQPCELYGLPNCVAMNKANLKTAADLCMKHGYTLSVQIHKLIGLP